MKIICKKNELLNGINIVSKAVPSKTTMSILQCILFDTTKGGIKLTANDTELGIETSIDGQVVEKGMVAIEAKIISDIIRKLPDNDITISSDDNGITIITCENSKFDIIGRSGEEFTYLPEVEKSDYIEISQLTFRNIINQTIFSVAVNDNNKILTGELLEVNNDRLRLIGLDGHRISIRNVELNASYSDKKVIIPGKTLSDISKIISGGADDMLKIFFTDKNIVFEFNETVVTSRLIEGNYFNVDQMLQIVPATSIVVNKKEFLDCIDRSTLLVKEGDKKPIIVTITDGQMELFMKSTIGTMNEKIDIEKYGEDLKIGFNPKFMIDSLKVIEDDTIKLYMQNAKAPCYIADDEKSYIYLVLPINFNSMY